MPTAFVYDGAGRRTRKTINGTITDVLYDGVNPIQEVSGAAAASHLTGLGIDEYFVRADTSGASALLTDALGSTVALSDTAGAVQTQYTYGPFGETITTGAASSNLFQYTGREQDVTGGLYYYRARYYHPRLQRFISEDQLALPGRDTNFYAYVLNRPTAFTDPAGLEPVTISAAAAVAIVCAAGAVAGDAVVLAVNGRKTTLGQLAAGAGIGCAGGVGVLAAYAAAAGATVVQAGTTITITTERLAHVLERHTPSGTLATLNKSIFSAGEDIVQLIQKAGSVVPTLQANGNLQRVVEAGRTIGLERVTRAATSTYTVISDVANNLITAFPGLP